MPLPSLTRRAAMLATPALRVTGCGAVLTVGSAIGSGRPTSAQVSPDRYADLRLRLDGHLRPGQELSRNLLLDTLYTSLPRDPQAKVQIYNYEIAPGGRTAWHCHNGATFFVTLQGEFEATFEEGVLVRARAGDVYSEPVARFHQGHNPHPELSCLGIGIQITAPDRDHITNAASRPW